MNMNNAEILEGTLLKKYTLLYEFKTEIFWQYNGKLYVPTPEELQLYKTYKQALECLLRMIGEKNLQEHLFDSEMSVDLLKSFKLIHQCGRKLEQNVVNYKKHDLSLKQYLLLEPDDSYYSLQEQIEMHSQCFRGMSRHRL